MSQTIQITLIKSLIGRLPKHKLIAHQLGLRKINKMVIHQDTASIRGLVNTIDYLVKIEEAVS